MSAQIDSHHLAHIRVDDTIPDYPILVVEHPHGCARIALHGAHVIDFQPTGQAPVLYTSPDALYVEGKAIRGGIPVCWPWFGAHPSDAAMPAHGFARNRFWQLISSSTCAAFTELIFSLDTSILPHALWPQATTAALRIRCGQSLELALTSTNHGTDAITIGGALHSYFSVSSIENIQIDGLDQADFLSIIIPKPGKQSGPIHITEETDRIYYPSSHTVEIHDAGLDRYIRIEKSGSNSTIVWNPWIEKSKGFSDLPDDGYRHFVCIETANALGDVHILNPGQSHTLGTRISVQHG